MKLNETELLLTLVFLAYGSDPKYTKDEKWPLEFKFESTAYDYAKKAIGHKELHAKTTNEGFEVDTSEFISWALKSGVGYAIAIEYMMQSDPVKNMVMP